MPLAEGDDGLNRFSTRPEDEGTLPLTYSDVLVTALGEVGVPLSPIIWQGGETTIQHTQFSDGFLSTIVDHATALFVANQLGDGYPQQVPMHASDQAMFGARL